MILGLTYMEIAWYFLLYSFIGWCVEVIFHAVVVGKIINRGFLNGPVCPVYGFGMLGILFLLNGLSNASTSIEDTNVFVCFLFGLVFCSFVELIAGWILDKVFHVKLWDYSEFPFNFHGYVCLRFSCLWGLGVVAVIKGVHPMLAEFSEHQFSAQPWFWWVILILYALYAVDLVLTVATMIGLNKYLRAIDTASSTIHVASDSLTEGIGGTAMKAGQVAGEAMVQASLMKDGIAEQVDITKNNVQELKEDVTGLAIKAKDGFAEQVDITKNNVQEIKEDLTDLAMKTRDEFAMRLEQMKKHILKYRILQRMLRAFPDANFHEHNEIMKKIRDAK